ncbi:adenylate kinase 7 isoform 2-T2 [Spinachia spinachia]
MALPRMKEPRQPPRIQRVFINHVDSYASECIAKCLSERVGGQLEEEEEEEELEITTHSAASAFHVVGTVSGRYGVEVPCVVEAYLKPNRDELLSKLMACDVIIYNITQHAEQVDEALWAVSALHNDMGLFSGSKMFILVSTVMTWACSKSLNYDFTDDHFSKRRAHPNFKPHIDLEKTVVHMGKTKRKFFSTYVVASGLQYGMGEQVFHYFFKTSWLGQENEIPIFGDGTNIVPTIHVSDLASVILNVIKHQPKPYYLLAVDSSSNTLEQIVKEVASIYGPRKIQKRPFEEAYLMEDLSGVHLKELFSIDWLCETGLVNNMELVVGEYQRARGLLPLRLCVLGPPAVGKSTVSREISKYYKVHHITLKETISETISQLEEEMRNADPHAVDDNSAAEAKELLNSLKDSMEQYGGLFDDQLLVKVMRNKLMSPPCRNQGFVLDGFPKTYEQAKELFYEREPEDGDTEMSTCRKKILPDFVLCLDASDVFLKHRVMMLPERLVQEHNYELEHFQRRLARYRGNNVEDETVVNYFDELDISPLYLEITSSEEPYHLLLMQTIFGTVGRPRNYGPTSQEVEEEERRKTEEKMRREAQEKAEEERHEAEEAEQRAALWKEWTVRLQEVRQQEEEVLEAESAPLRNYLMEHVMPTLTQGLITCCTARPQDPVDFLAEFLTRNNPINQ